MLTLTGNMTLWWWSDRNDNIQATYINGVLPLKLKLTLKSKVQNDGKYTTVIGSTRFLWTLINIYYRYIY